MFLTVNVMLILDIIMTMTMTNQNQQIHLYQNNVKKVILLMLQVQKLYQNVNNVFQNVMLIIMKLLIVHSLLIEYVHHYLIIQLKIKMVQISFVTKTILKEATNVLRVQMKLHQFKEVHLFHNVLQMRVIILIHNHLQMMKLCLYQLMHNNAVQEHIVLVVQLVKHHVLIIQLLLLDPPIYHNVMLILDFFIIMQYIVKDNLVYPVIIVQVVSVLLYKMLVLQILIILYLDKLMKMLVIYVNMKLLQKKEVQHVLIVLQYLHLQQIEVLLDNIDIITINKMDVDYQQEHVVINNYQQKREN